MPSVGGDILEVRVAHPTLGNHVFFPKSNEGNPFNPGGIRSGDDENMITATGDPMYQLNMTRGSFEVLVAEDMNQRMDSAFAVALAGDKADANYTVSLVNGTVWGMSGRPVGDIVVDTNQSTFTLKIAGGSATKLVG
jgi:hypothetical protein